VNREGVVTITLSAGQAIALAECAWERVYGAPTLPYAPAQLLLEARAALLAPIEVPTRGRCEFCPDTDTPGCAVCAPSELLEAVP
jgi:hypothetical protein